MKKLEKILKDVRKDIQARMEDTAYHGGKHFVYEKVIGTAYIDIDFWETCNFPWLHADFDIMVSHEDSHKRSPLLEKAIRAVMPDWFEIKEKMKQIA